MLSEELFSLGIASICIIVLTLLCTLLRKFKRAMIPNEYQIFIEEFICLFQIVAGIKEGDIVLDSSDIYTYAVYLFVLFASFGVSFEGCGSTCGLWEQLLFRNISVFDCLVASAMQIMGGFLGLSYIKLFWRAIGLGSYHAKMFKHSTEDICNSAMQATLVEGMVAEFVATILFSIYLNGFRGRSFITEKRAPYFDAFVTCVIVIVGMDYTGMMFNPALATALTYNCKGHTLVEHLLVYWLSPLLATLSSCAFFNQYLRDQIKVKERTD